MFFWRVNKLHIAVQRSTKHRYFWTMKFWFKRRLVRSPVEFFIIIDFTTNKSDFNNQQPKNTKTPLSIIFSTWWIGAIFPTLVSSFQNSECLLVITHILAPAYILTQVLLFNGVIYFIWVFTKILFCSIFSWWGTSSINDIQASHPLSTHATGWPLCHAFVFNFLHTLMVALVQISSFLRANQWGMNHHIRLTCQSSLHVGVPIYIMFAPSWPIG